MESSGLLTIFTKIIKMSLFEIRYLRVQNNKDIKDHSSQHRLQYFQDTRNLQIFFIYHFPLRICMIREINMESLLAIMYVN